MACQRRSLGQRQPSGERDPDERMPKVVHASMNGSVRRFGASNKAHALATCGYAGQTIGAANVTIS